MLILSWNVAGFSSTVHRIHEHYGSIASSSSSSKVEGNLPKEVANTSSQKTASTKSKPSHHPLIYYFQRHQADIICIQEHKISHQQLLNRNEPYHCSLGRDHQLYDSYWSCCTDPKYKGFNGVVTYVKKSGNDDVGGGVVLSANGTSPFRDVDLDAQGRCVITEHGSSPDAPGFVLFNVYVPCGGGTAASLTRKMKFLHALRRTMHEQRRTRQKPVILVGDLNISYAKEDVHWKDRVIYINDIIAEARDPPPSYKMVMWKTLIIRHWPTIVRILETTGEVIPVRTTNSKTGEVFQKFRFTVTIDTTKSNAKNEKGQRICLGQPETSVEECRYNYNFQQQSYIDEDSEQSVIIREENMVSVSVLSELMNKLIFRQQEMMPDWDEDLCKEISRSMGTVNRTSPARLWLQSLYEEDQMVDAFRYYYPQAAHRFTCWNQNKNHRYSNYGTRIDYTLIDASLVPYLEKGDVRTLRCPTNEMAHTEAGAWQAVTANGQYQPAPYEGGGMVEASPELLDSQFGIPHTGHIYTPPTYSDHIAVSLLLNDSVVLSSNCTHPNDSSFSPVTDGKDSSTRKSQPHKQQPTIGSFFQKVDPSAARSKATPTSPSERHKKRSKVQHAKNPPPNSVWHHFHKKET